MRAARTFIPTLMLTLATASCGVTHLQTARTTPAGETRTTIGVSYVRNDLRDDFGLSDVPIDVMVRHGVRPQVDFGVRLFFGLGVLADVKWNLLRPDRKTALAVSGGFGTAVDPTSPKSTTVLRVPLTVTLSRELLPWLTPYGAIGYDTFWIFNHGSRDPMVTYADRTGTGDGVLALHAGIELATATGRAVFFEYGYLHPVVNDPGDFYAFASSHLFSIAFRTGRGSSEPLLSR